jgi:hypothetical protein
MSSFDHLTLIQHIGQQMTSLRKPQPEAMQGFGEWAKAAMTRGPRPAEGLRVTVSQR